MITRAITYSLLFLSISLFFACSRQTGGVEKLLDEVENIVEQQPDSAYKMLNTILFPEDLNRNLFNKYSLLMIQAKDKCDKDITSDTLIFSTKVYYLKKEDYPNVVLAAFYCGRVWHEQNNVEKAAAAYLEAIDLAANLKDYNLRGLIYGNLGILYQENDLEKKAIAVSKNAVEMYDKAENYKNKISALCVIGNCFLLENEMDSAFYYYNESLKFADFHKIMDMQSNVRQNIGVVYRKTGDYKKAKEYFKEALSFSPDSVEQIRILMNIAKVYIFENQTDSARFYLNQALAFQTSDPKLLRSSYFLLSEIEKNNKHYQEALKYFNAYYDYTMKVFDNEQNAKIIEMQEKYDFEKLKNFNNKLTIKHQYTLIIGSLILFMACIVIFLFYLQYLRSEKSKLETDQNIIILKKLADDYEKQLNDYSEKEQSFQNILLAHFNILKKVALIENEIPENEQKNGQWFIKKYHKIVYGQNDLDWNKLYETLNALRNGFYDKVREKYPKLTDIEFRVCCLSCETDFNDKEMTVFIGKTVWMVQRIRSDLRKKLGMAPRENIYSFLLQSLSINK
ncbi:MAG: tetratricopeptide repeat protein [Candidatus Symbiothrix sp.]|jgi:tetratricopeptide (TPR) repeat protein|nr:tetratricopeptide repeat protein [Candidatus Symbiothrix sp.]